MNTDDEKGYELVRTPGGPLTSSKEVSEWYTPTCTPVDYDSEDVQLSARTDDGDVVVYLPEITYLDTQQWSVEIGLTPDRLVQLRDALDNHLRGAAGTAGPANRGEEPAVAGEVEQLRAIVARCQGLADWLARHSDFGVDIEADSIRRAIGDRLRTMLDPSTPPAEWEDH
ncbi:hypothetical protein ACIRQT_07070 [Streptomyces californicus]|uniref:hypothetical protein n=1 Tax=Streptomyces californicus TaxID=67351 RepID=UPI003822AA59